MARIAVGLPVSLVVFSTILGGQGKAVARPEQGGEPQPAAGFPAVWTSLTSGTVRRIRRTDDHIYVALIETDEARAAGAFGSGDLERDSTVYRGTWHSRLFGSTRDVWSGTPKLRTCLGETEMVLTLVTRERIEGRTLAPTDAGDNAAIDWNTCRFKSVTWMQFVWVPKP